MHVGLIIYGSLDTVSGGYLYDRMLVNHLREMGDTVTIISLPWRTYGAHLLDNWDADLWAQLISADFDILIQDELNHPSLVRLNQRLRQVVSYPIITIVHNLHWLTPRNKLENRFYRSVEKRYLKSVDGFVFNSQTTKTAVHTLIGKTPNHIIAQPAGDRFVGHPLQQQPQTHTDTLRLLHLATVIPLKGLNTVLHALAQLSNTNWTLDVVGDLTRDPAYAQQMQQQAKALDINDKVRFWGTLHGDELAQRFAETDMMVLPSAYEGFGIAYLEAMSFGLAVVGSTSGAAGELIKDRETGFLVQAQDVKGLAEVLREVGENRPFLQTLQQNAHTHFKTFPTWQDTCQQIREFLLRQ